MNQLCIGIFITQQDASMAVEALKKEGINEKKDISVLSRDIRDLEWISKDSGVKKPEAGAGNSGIFGYVKGWVSQLDVTPKEIAVSGPAARKFAGTAIGPETDDLVVGLVGSGVPEEDAQKYEEFLLKGHMLMLIVCNPDQVANVNEILLSNQSLTLD